MSMFSGYTAVIRALTRDDKRKMRALGEYDDVNTDAIKAKVKKLVATGKYTFVGTYWERLGSETSYRITEWNNGTWTDPEDGK